MIKNRRVQLVYLTAACTIGILGVLASTGLFEADFRWDFYIYYTNISNYFCVAVLFTEMLGVLRAREDGYIDTHPKLKFVGLVGILLTFLMFNIVMAPTKSWAYNLSIRSISLHVLIPILYVLDWFLFYERKKTDWKYPMISLALPISYIVFVLIHAAVLKFDSSILCFAGDAPLIYPYFFLNYDKLGADGLLTWCAVLVFALLAGGYLFCLLDRVTFKKECAAKSKKKNG